jgi:hypothetical protein
MASLLPRVSAIGRLGWNRAIPRVAASYRLRWNRAIPRVAASGRLCWNRAIPRVAASFRPPPLAPPPRRAPAPARPRRDSRRARPWQGVGVVLLGGGAVAAQHQLRPLLQLQLPPGPRRVAQDARNSAGRSVQVRRGREGNERGKAEEAGALVLLGSVPHFPLSPSLPACLLAPPPPPRGAAKQRERS